MITPVINLAVLLWDAIIEILISFNLLRTIERIFGAGGGGEGTTFFGFSFKLGSWTP